MFEGIDFDELFRLADSNGAQQKRQELVPLMRRIMDLPQRKWCLEIGSYNGGTARVLCKLFDNVISIDIAPQQKGWEKLRETSHNWFGIVGDSKADILLGHFKKLGVEFDFIFIDGDHTYEGCMTDFLNYAPFLAPEGVVAFHDIIETQFHHENNCFVDKVWTNIKAFGFTTEEFVFDGIGHTGEFHSHAHPSTWGGIGIVLHASPKSIRQDVHFMSENA